MEYVRADSSPLIYVFRNFAGIVGPLCDIAETNLEHWKKVIDINATGVWLCNKYELRQMIKQNSIEVLVSPSTLCDKIRADILFCVLESRVARHSRAPL